LTRDTEQQTEDGTMVGTKSTSEQGTGTGTGTGLHVDESEHENEQETGGTGPTLICTLFVFVCL
jgi:hypothetical protein